MEALKSQWPPTGRVNIRSCSEILGMSDPLRFSVVVPVHNKGPHVRRAINSVLNQTLQDFELLVVNDASTDNTFAEIQRICDHRLRLLSRAEPGPGGYAARNLGIRESEGIWVAFLDADDEWKTEHLHDMWELARAFPSSGFLSCGWEEVDADGALKQDAYYLSHQAEGPHEISLGEYLKASIQGRRPVNASVACMKRSEDAVIGIFPDGRALSGGDLNAFVSLMTHTTMAWSPHVGATYHRNSVNMVTRTARFDPKTPRLMVHETAPFCTPRERLLLRKYCNRRVSQKLLESKLTGTEVFPLARSLFWRGDLLFCLTRCLLAVTPNWLFQLRRWVKRLVLHLPAGRLQR